MLYLLFNWLGWTYFLNYNFLFGLLIVVVLRVLLKKSNNYYYVLKEDTPLSTLKKTTALLKKMVTVSLVIYLTIGHIYLLNSFFNTTNNVVLLGFCLILHAIFYFITIYHASKFTTQIKYYWIRVYHVIWLMEIYLFFLLIFLYIIHPEELKWGFNECYWLVIRKPNYTFYNMFKLIFLLLIINLSLTIATINGNLTLIKWALLFNTLSMIYIFHKEFLILLNSQLFSQIIDLKTRTVELSFSNRDTVNFIDFNKKLHTDEIRRHNPGKFILNVILITKYLHVFFIVLINLIMIANIINNNFKSSLVSLGLIQQNIIIILLFYYSNYIIFFKFLYKLMIYGPYKSSTLYYVLSKWYYFFLNY